MTTNPEQRKEMREWAVGCLKAAVQAGFEENRLPGDVLILLDEVEELEGKFRVCADGVAVWVNRAEQAETRVRRLEGALRDFLEEFGESDFTGAKKPAVRLRTYNAARQALNENPQEVSDA